LFESLGDSEYSPFSSVGIDAIEPVAEARDQDVDWPRSAFFLRFRESGFAIAVPHLEPVHFHPVSGDLLGFHNEDRLRDGGAGR
jgi:hypothetical protein